MSPHPDEALLVAALPTGEQVVGLLPAGGQGTRIGPLPCSKELFPIGFRSHEEGQDLRPKVVVLAETPYLDIDTPDSLLGAVERSSREQRHV